VSYIHKKDTRAALYEPHLTDALLFISFMTQAELERWAIAKNWGARRYAEMLQMVRARFAVIESTPPLCRKWAEVTEQVKRAGRVIHPNDAWVAATALLYNSSLITHNAGDFAHVEGLDVITEGN
jgi:predicted nucleic acid-binding protein